MKHLKTSMSQVEMLRDRAQKMLKEADAIEKMQEKLSRFRISDPVDWNAVITTLVTAGFTFQLLADSIGVPKSSLVGWNQGASPRFDSGYNLIRIWIEITCLTLDDVPRVKSE